MNLLEVKLAPKLMHKLRLTPRVKLALNLLQLPMAQLKDYLKNEIEKNPLLESAEDDYRFKDEAFKQNTSLTDYDEEKIQYQQSILTAPQTIPEYLLEQFRLLIKSKEELKIGEFIIDCLDENGYFSVSIQEAAKTLNVSASKVKEVLNIIQTLEPAGIGARDLRQCLLIQLNAKGRKKSLAFKIVDKYLSFLEKRNYEDIAKKLSSKNQKISVAQVKESLKELAQLEPKPARLIDDIKTIRIIPDVIVKPVRSDDAPRFREDKFYPALSNGVNKNKQNYEIILNENELPHLIINDKYKKIMKQKDTPEDTKAYLQRGLQGALFLIDAFRRRKETIKMIVEYIVKIQKDFLNDKALGLKPLTLEQIAMEVGKHKSTISRAIKDKYIQTPHGTFELRYFLTSKIKQENGEDVSSNTIKLKIKELTKNENKTKPLTDREITELLNKEAILINRRTVTKYRKQLKLLPSRLRTN